jgi:hypothetical protein
MIRDLIRFLGYYLLQRSCGLIYPFTHAEAEISIMAALKALVSKGFRSTLLAPELRK